MAVTCAQGWQGSSNQGRYENHESSLSEVEMIALGESIIDLGQMKNLPPGTQQCFQDLASALKTGNVIITKGIHQRESKVHFDVKSSRNALGTFHVFVVPGAEVGVISPPVLGGWGVSAKIQGKTVTRSLFQYVVSGLSYRVGQMDYLYPALFNMLSEVEKPLGRPRGKSFSLGNSNAIVTRAEMESLSNA